MNQIIGKILLERPFRSLPNNEWGRNRHVIVLGEDITLARFTNDANPEGQFATFYIWLKPGIEAQRYLELPSANKASVKHLVKLIKGTTAEIAEMLSSEVVQLRANNFIFLGSDSICAPLN